MKRAVIAALLLWALFCPADAYWQSRDSNYDKVITVAGGGYTGPGDVGLTYYAFYNCGRAYTAAYASGGGSLCEVTRFSTHTTCMMVAKTNGFVDLTTANCNGSTQTIVQFCNATTCGVDKAVDQTGSGTKDALQATEANMPTITFSDLNGLPSMTCAVSVVCYVETSGSFTISLPITLIAAFKRSANPSSPGGVIGSGSSGNLAVGPGNSSGVIDCTTGTGSDVASGGVSAGTEGSYSAVSCLLASVTDTCALNIHGVDNAPLTCNASTGWSTLTIRLMRSGQVAGSLLEAGIIAAGTNSTNRGTIFTNINSVNGYNGGL